MNPKGTPTYMDYVDRRRLLVRLFKLYKEDVTLIPEGWAITETHVIKLPILDLVETPSKPIDPPLQVPFLQLPNWVLSMLYGHLLSQLHIRSWPIVRTTKTLLIFEQVIQTFERHMDIVP